MMWSRHARILVLSIAPFAAACDPSFDPVSEVKGLRVLGVQKDKPYPAPGESVRLSMLWHDGFVDPEGGAAPRDVQIAWLSPCFNPPGDLYYACADQLGGLPAAGSVTDIQIPADIVESRGEPARGQAKYGLTFAFFALCAGRFTALEATQPGALPLGCEDEAGKALGAESFVAGYVSLYTFADGFVNQNPTIDGLTIEGESVPACLDDECLTAAEEEVDCTAQPGRCFPVCEDDGESSCPDIIIKPSIDESTAERDEVSATYFNRDVSEQMWINYYVDRGSVRTPVRLLNDAAEGWNADYGMEYWAPDEPGPVNIWTVAHDNRGGASWARTRIQITP